MNIAITFEFWIVYGPLMASLDWSDPLQVFLFVYMTVIHTLPLITCLTNGYLS